MNTKEKIAALVAHARTLAPEQLPKDVRGLVSNFQTLRGFAGLVPGVPQIPADPLSLLIPDDNSSAEILLDKMICLLLEPPLRRLPTLRPEHVRRERDRSPARCWR